MLSCTMSLSHLQRWSSSSNSRSRGTSWCVCGLHSLGLAVGLCWRCLILWLHNADVIRQWASWSNLASWVPWQHNLYLDSQHTLTQQDVTDSHIDIVVHGVTTVDHESVCELHRLGSLASELARHNNFTDLWWQPSRHRALQFLLGNQIFSGQRMSVP